MHLLLVVALCQFYLYVFDTQYLLNSCEKLGCLCCIIMLWTGFWVFEGGCGVPQQGAVDCCVAVLQLAMAVSNVERC